jgi:hypothetical protein
MAKKDKKDDKAGGKAVPNDAVDAVRAAVERTLQAAGGTTGARERTRELIDDFSAFAGRFRETLDDLRALEDVRTLRTELDAVSARVEALTARVAALEADRTAAAKPAARKPPGPKPPAPGGAPGDG